MHILDGYHLKEWERITIITIEIEESKEAKS